MAANTRSPLTFFILVFMLSVPFWVVGTFVQPENLPINLPVSALMAFNPLIVAVFLVYRAEGGEGVRRLFRRVFDFRKIQAKRWYLAIFLVMPVAMILVYILMSLTGNMIANPQFAILSAPIMFVAFFVAAAGEEVGWMGYAVEPMQVRWNALTVSLIIGVVWAVWHVIPNMQAHHTADWILWQFLTTIALRVLIVWIFSNSGRSLFAAISFHAMINVSNFMFPNYGSHYDPYWWFVILSLMCVLVVGLWGYKTLAEYRFSAA